MSIGRLRESAGTEESSRSVVARSTAEVIAPLVGRCRSWSFVVFLPAVFSLQGVEGKDVPSTRPHLLRCDDGSLFYAALIAPFPMANGLMRRGKAKSEREA